MDITEYAAQIKRLQSKHPEEVYKANLRGLLDAVRDGSLTKQDVLLYTDIPAYKLDELLIGKCPACGGEIINSKIFCNRESVSCQYAADLV